MKCTILKAFPYAHDGNQTEMLTPGGEDREIRDDLVNGLVAAGLIARPTEKKATVPDGSVAQIVASEDKMAHAPPENKIAHEAEPHRHHSDTAPQRDRRKKR